MGIVIINMTEDQEEDQDHHDEPPEKEETKGSKRPPYEWDLEPQLQIVS